MGSFNETCALSGLNISPGTLVKLLFLTQNPYIASDEHEAQRGCYHHDQWFVRTPPVVGIYDDYGRCQFKDDSISKLIAEVFSEDIVERPFGFNQYHAHPVAKGQDIHHYLTAAWDGRLLVYDGYSNSKRKEDTSHLHWPTWRKVQNALAAARLPIQDDEGKKGYNAQPIEDGVVVVTFNDYGDTTNQLKKAANILEKHYDTRIVYRHADRQDDGCLLVVHKGAFENKTIITSKREVSFDHPERRVDKVRQLPTLAVMARTDVWDVYCNSEYEGWNGPVDSVKNIVEKIRQCYPDPKPVPKIKKKKLTGVAAVQAEVEKTKEEIARVVAEIDGRSRKYGLSMDIPFQTVAQTHLEFASNKKNFKKKDELIKRCAELFKVERIMELLHHSWHIPPLGGQDGAWELRTNLLSQITAISQKELEQEREYQ